MCIPAPSSSCDLNVTREYLYLLGQLEIAVSDSVFALPLRVFFFLNLYGPTVINKNACIQQQDCGREIDLVSPPSTSALKSNGKGQLTAITAIIPSLWKHKRFYP